MMALQPSVGPCQLFQFLDRIYTVGRTPWTGDQPVVRPLLTQRATQTQKNAHTDIHAWSGIRTHDPSVRAGKDSSCFRRRGYSDRPSIFKFKKINPFALEGPKLPLQIMLLSLPKNQNSATLFYGVSRKLLI
jgi:hypothetical protein